MSAIDFISGPHPVYGDELAYFGSSWTGPRSLTHFKETAVAFFPKNSGGDGQSVEVLCTACPAKFYTLKVFGEPNSVGEHQAPYTVNFGSGSAELAAQLAREIARGMLSFKPDAP